MNDEKFDKIKRLESTLTFLIKPDMDIDTKLKRLEDSFFRSHNSGYCNYMAGEEMGGVCNAETERWDLDCKYKYEVELLIELLKQGESTDAKNP